MQALSMITLSTILMLGSGFALRSPTARTNSRSSLAVLHRSFDFNSYFTLADNAPSSIAIRLHVLRDGY